MEWLEELSKIGLPTIIVILVGLFGFIKGVEACWKWIKEKFLYFYNSKKNKDKLVQDVTTHDNEIHSIHEKIDALTEVINGRFERDDKYDRDTARVILLDMYDKVKDQGYVTMIQKEAYDELYASYEAKNGNGLFKKTINPFIQNLEVKD